VVRDRDGNVYDVADNVVKWLAAAERRFEKADAEAGERSKVPATSYESVMEEFAHGPTATDSIPEAAASSRQSLLGADQRHPPRNPQIATYPDTDTTFSSVGKFVGRRRVGPRGRCPERDALRPLAALRPLVVLGEVGVSQPGADV
jgi:hypothetical protein